MSNSIRELDTSGVSAVIERLRLTAVGDGWVINDLMYFPLQSAFYYCGDVASPSFSFLHRSGHPASRKLKTIIMRGKLSLVTDLLMHSLPQSPFVIRETPLTLLPIVRSLFPEAKIFPQVQLVADRDSIKRYDTGRALVLTSFDLEALASFTCSPRESKPNLTAWVNGTVVVGVYENSVLAAIGSIMFSLPEVCALVSIRTDTRYRGRGYASQVTSKLTEIGHQRSNCVTLTVRSDNTSALRLYQRLGFVFFQERMWATLGHNVVP